MSPDGKDHYTTLGVPKSATVDEIRRAYRKMALRFHPDRNPGDMAAEATFKRASQAYEVLSDADKRAKYDRGATAPPPPPPKPKYPVARTGPVEVVIDPLEHAKGCGKHVTVSRRRTCPSCGGSGTLDPAYWTVCALCVGGGCNACEGLGRNSRCAQCFGSGSDNETTTIRVTVPPGLAPAMRHQLVGDGDLWGLRGPFYIDAKLFVRAHKPGLIIR